MNSLDIQDSIKTAQFEGKSNAKSFTGEQEMSHQQRLRQATTIGIL